MPKSGTAPTRSVNRQLRVDTNDASIEVTQGVSRTISVKVISDGMSIGNTGVRVTDHQDADKIDLQVHVPNEWGFHIGMHRGVQVQVQVPPQSALDLHSGDGHIALTGVSGQARLDSGDGHIASRTSTARCVDTPATVT